MVEKRFVLMSLKEKNTKKLASLLNSDTARKILDYLSSVDYATETKISKETNTPLSTVHYNLKLLRENKLVNEEEFHYSEKGKEVIHYKAANKYIIIAPEGEDENILDKLKGILPGFIGLIIGSATLFFYSLFGKSTNLSKAVQYSPVISSAENSILPTIAPNVTGVEYVAKDVFVNESKKVIMEPLKRTIPETINSVNHQFINPSFIFEPWLWFLLGGLFVLIIILIYVLTKNKK